MSLRNGEGPPPPPPLVLLPEIVSESPRGLSSALAVHSGLLALQTAPQTETETILDHLPTARQTRDGNGNDTGQGKDGNGNGQGPCRSSQLSKGEKVQTEKGRQKGERKGVGKREKDRGRASPLSSLAFLPFFLESFLSHVRARVRNKKFPFIPFFRPFIRKKMPLV